MTDADASTVRRRRIAGGALVAVLAAALVAIVVVRSGGAKVVNTGGDTVVLVGEKMSGGLDALGSGRLADVGGCLGFAPTDGEPAGTVVVWPHGTNVETPEPLRVRIDGTVHELGDTVRLGGGYGDPLSPDSPYYHQVPEGCRTAGVFYAASD